MPTKPNQHPKIFIGGLAPNVEEMDLAILVSIHGHVDAIKIVRDRKTGKNKGYAFLDIPKMADVQNIISMLNGEKFQGNTLTVKLSEEGAAKAPIKRSFKPNLK
jgi:RNA recognition motif-containing protein